ncbi:MAG: hypothetical protein H0U16_06155 [Actinobacteria bacterium]|nr:hypothetical protein [Actinomycetota bacterium]
MGVARQTTWPAMTSGDDSAPSSLCPGCGAPALEVERDPVVRAVFYTFSCGATIGVAEDVFAHISPQELQEVLDGHWESNRDDHRGTDRRAGAHSGRGEGGSARAVAPDAIEPITAWRIWKLHPARIVRFVPVAQGFDTYGRCQALGGVIRYELRSLNESTVWIPGRRQEARCQRRALHASYSCPSPADNCACGIYAGRQLSTVIRGHLPGAARPDPQIVVGQVKLWGKIRIGSRGFRARYAYPVSLFVSPEMRAALPDLGDFEVALYETRWEDVARLMSHPDIARSLPAASVRHSPRRETSPLAHPA